MANVFDTAQYILEQCGPMQVMKLQKLCYYCQAWSLVWDQAPLFDEDFEAWQTGPVCRELFLGAKNCPCMSAADIRENDSRLTANQKDTIRRVISHYAEKNAWYLCQLTMMEDPWKKARKGLPYNVESDRMITKESIAEYYGKLSENFWK